MLQRIYGTAWESKADLEAHLKKLEEIEKRDHRRLGKELDLYSIHEEAGAGLIYWHPKGARVRLAIEDFWRSEHLKNGYELLYTPHIGKGWLWETSGHLGFYKQNMYAPAVDRRRGLLPQADELPVPPHDLQEPAALLPRPSAALGRAGHRVPLREVRRPARPPARARLHAGRRAHHLHPRADRRRDPRGPAVLPEDLEGVRVHGHQGLPRHQAGRTASATTRPGTRPSPP